jgi:hypothetical protein
LTVAAAAFASKAILFLRSSTQGQDEAQAREQERDAHDDPEERDVLREERRVQRGGQGRSASYRA